jgi:hypothetical protein
VIRTRAITLLNGIAKTCLDCFLDRSLTAFLECAHSAVCAPYKHHYDECVERVTRQEEQGDDFKGPKEDCVEECKYNKKLAIPLGIDLESEIVWLT